MRLNAANLWTMTLRILGFGGTHRVCLQGGGGGFMFSETAVRTFILYNARTYEGVLISP